MEEKERYEVMSPSLNGYAYIHDLKTDNVLNTYDSCDLLNQQSKRLKEFEQENRQLKKQLEQDKISFAVKQLEKVKEKLLEELQNVTDLLDPLEYEDYHELIGCGRGYKNSIEEIDNQIKQIKERCKND